MFLFAKVLAVTVSIFAVISILQKISSTIRLRKKEFALLQAMGMTKTRIYRMILLEHSIYGIVGLFIGIPLSLFLMVQIFAEFEIPFAEITKRDDSMSGNRSSTFPNWIRHCISIFAHDFDNAENRYD